MCNKFVAESKDFRSTLHLTRFRTNQINGSGFSLIELMTTIGIIGILAVVAIPSYISFTKNGDAANALTTLVNLSTQMEKRYLDFRNYGTNNSCGVAAPPADEFTFTCSSDGQTYTWTATSSDSKYQYSIDQNGTKSTKKFDGSNSNESCWKINDNGDCY